MAEWTYHATVRETVAKDDKRPRSLPSRDLRSCPLCKEKVRYPHECPKFRELM